MFKKTKEQLTLKLLKLVIFKNWSYTYLSISNQYIIWWSLWESSLNQQILTVAVCTEGCYAIIYYKSVKNEIYTFRKKKSSDSKDTPQGCIL